MRWNTPSQLAKKNSLSFLIGPPKFPPISLRISFGLLVGGSPFAFDLQFTSNASQESKCWLWLYQNSTPWRSFVPDLVMTSTAAEPAIPFSGS